MGTFTVTVEVGDPQGQRFESVQAMVDTGASDTMVPRSILTQLGIEAMERYEFQLADSTVVEYDVGETRLRIDGRERTVPVIFGPEGTPPLLGATTLEVFRLGVDPVGQRLIPVRGRLNGNGFRPA
jgi:clan AA aspartic protease